MHFNVKCTAICVILLLFTLPAWGNYGGGSGTAGEPYLIYTAEQMNAIGLDRFNWDKHFKLMADIDLGIFEGKSFNMIGSEWPPFSGVFDGNGHTISNFTYVIDDNPAKYIGLFRRIYDTAEIKNLGLIDPNIYPSPTVTHWVHRIGSLVGHVDNGTISDCYVKGGSVTACAITGGLIGFNAGTIDRCYATCDVILFSQCELLDGAVLGGLVGTNDALYSEEGPGIIRDCFAAGNVYAMNAHIVGGLVGSNNGGVSSSYAIGNVEGRYAVGGLVGYNRAKISTCYSTGEVTGSSEPVGGLVGDIDTAGTVSQSFWDTQTSGQPTSAGGTGKTTAEMKIIGTFTSASWDFWNTWTICEGTNYPVLQWQILPCDFLCPDGVNFIDFSFFTEHWLDENCTADDDYCQGTDLDQSGSVDSSDLVIFAENWLEGIYFIE